MVYFKNRVIIAIFLLLIAAMFFLIWLSANKAPVKVSYYHWKGIYSVDSDTVKQLNAHQTYIKFLDIAYSTKLEIIYTKFKTQPKGKITPVVYLDNRVLKKTGIKQILLAIRQKIDTAQYNALQLDCDWTLSTKNKYFQLLKELGKDYKYLSATIRLHQIKYFKKTGVPPVKSGVLMYYNMSDIRDITTKNAILDLDIAQKYHVNFYQYPLPLDIALPLYQQTRVVRQNKVITLLTGKGLNKEKLEKISPNKFKVKQAHYVQKTYLYKDDLLIVDQISKQQLQAAARALEPLVSPSEIIFYELSHAKDFGYESIESIRRIFN